MTLFPRKIRSRISSALSSQSLRRLLPYIEKHFVVLAACFLLVFVLARTDDWLYRNEVFDWLATGIPFDADHPSLSAFVDAAVETCEVYGAELLSVCRDYQNTFLKNTDFHHPLHSFIGAALLKSYGDRPWLEDLHHAAILSQMVGGFLAIGLWFLLIVSLPSSIRNFAASLTLLLIVLGYYRDEPTVILPDPFANGVQAWEVPALVLIAAAFLFGQRWGERFFLHGRLDLARKIAEHRKRVLQTFFCVLLVNLIFPPIGAALVQIVALAGAFIAIWWMISSENLRPIVAGSVFFLLFLMLSGDSSMLVRKLEIPTSQLYLVFGAYLAYVAVKPRGALVFGLPALALFHLPLTAMLGLALLLSELPLGLRRLRLSPLLLVSAPTFVVGYWLMQTGTASRLVDVSVSNLPISPVLAMVLDSPRLWPTILLLALTAMVSLWPLLLRDESWDHVARCGFLALQCIGASTLSHAILDADPGLRLEPTYFALTLLSIYLNPLAYGVVLSLSLVLFRMCARDEPVVPDRPPFASVDWKRIGTVAMIILFLGLAKIDLRPRLLFLDAFYNTVVYVALGQVHGDWCRYLAQGAGFDDQYILSDRKPTSGVENAFSALKLKIRIARGEHDPAQMRVSVARKDDGCW